MRDHRPGAGFTLVELLVCLAIVAILAAMLFPVLAQAHARGRSGVCQANLHHLGLAVLEYCSDNDNRLPPTFYVVGYPGPNPRAFYIMKILGPYYVENKVSHCPGEPPGSNWGYGVNPIVRHWMIEELADPCRTIVMADNSGQPTHVGPPTGPVLTVDNPAERHLGMANFWFADGHLKAMKAWATVQPDYLWDRF